MRRRDGPGAIRSFVGGAGGFERPDDGGFTAATGEHERRLRGAHESVDLFAASEVGIGPLFEEQLHQGGVFALRRRGPMHGQITVGEARDGLDGAVVQQQSGGLELIGPGRLGQGCAHRIRRVNLRARVQQQLDDPGIAAERRPHQRTAATAKEEAGLVGRWLGVGIRPVPQEQLDRLRVTASRRRHQCGAAEQIGRPRVRTGRQEEPNCPMRLRRPRGQHRARCCPMRTGGSPRRRVPAGARTLKSSGAARMRALAPAALVALTVAPRSRRSRIASGLAWTVASIKAVLPRVSRAFGSAP